MFIITTNNAVANIVNAMIGTMISDALQRDEYHQNNEAKKYCYNGTGIGYIKVKYLKRGS